MTGHRGHSPEERFRSPGLRVLGVVYLVIVAVFLWLTIAIYRDVFSTDVPVTLRADQVGNQLQAHADVKMRGLIVGSVRAVDSHGDAAELELAMDPELIDKVPRNVSARLLPKTLFGERYVSLVEPENPAPTSLSAGDVIGQDRSAASIELERVLNNLLPLLRSVEPAELASTLNALARALEGRGEPLGDTLVRVGNYLGELNPQLPEIKADITAFADVSDTYDGAAGDFMHALSDLTVTSRTVVEQRANLDALYRTLTVATKDVTGFLERNKDTLIRLSASARPTLDVLARYAPQYACMLDSVTDLIPRLEKTFGKGTDKPGLHVKLRFVPDRGQYHPGADDPRYDDKRGPRCYGSGGDEPPAEIPALSMMDSEMGAANSPQERNFLAAVLAPTLGVRPAEVPEWSGLLVGPLLRGTEVEFE
ncbi:MCE family protein [Amycolatopsis cihanbeyliensis]|uniref:Phospholipid/cholesterol/gamma-HCH transport system substrate-binding protein n=1 Tax=Amycolatopsis cihanbeyliensis TaxID=1128664 RepID=A0A542DMM9_AMYCI|nr:MCE family protein [Amycolatopsis cihanbeyliensis]TQJ04234.1 phospholipid/cholesterol/gamma-HCH transport system substrate-binding protein [Amycolatopsis cihanbeyliensis]